MRPVIIGAGPIGSHTARLIKKLDPLIIEARSRVGVPVQCTGIVSPRLKELTRFPNELIVNRIRGARLYSENEEVEVKGKAHVINRQGFDEWLHKKSMAETNFNERFIKCSKKRVRTSKNTYKTNLVIDCSGPKQGLIGVQAVARLKKDDDFVELHFHECPGFFAWIVPTGNYCRIGLASKGKAMPMLKNFLKKIKAGKVKEWNAGLIPMKVNEFVSDNYIKCGDAAGQVKATTGGGLVTGVMSSIIMSKAVLKAYEDGNYTKSFFTKHYYKPWKMVVGKELRMHSLVRHYLNSLKSHDDLLRFIKNNKTLLEGYGDMDLPSKYLLRLLKPRNLGFIAKSLWNIVRRGLPSLNFYFNAL
jgi:digeranylgeranylglycerophospholipid reductase